MTYDNNGNLSTVVNGCGTTTYTWDVRNRLSAINGYKADCSSLNASSKYDAIGRRIEKTINGATTKFLYDGLDIIQEIVGTAKTNYIRTLNIDEPLTRIKADGTIRHYVKDALGSIIALTDDTGAVKTTYTYDPFGNVTTTGETSDNPFQFVGKENDGTGLIREGYRYYSFDLQRYISEDPIDINSGDVNFYVRTGNDPINWIDPYGLYSMDEFLRDTGNISAGFGDTLTSGFGLTHLVGIPSLTEYIRQQMGVDDAVNKCSGAYTAGKIAGYAWGVAFTASAASGGGPWLGKIKIHGPHAGGPHQYRHLQIMIRVGKHTTKHIRIP